MRRALVLFFLVASPSWATYSGYTYQRTITIDHTKVSTQALTYTDLAVLLSTNTPLLSTAAVGGHLSDVNGFDLIYSTMSDCSFNLSWDTETVNNTGAVVRNEWVRIPSISSTTDTTFYQCYGNASATTYQGASPSTWDSLYMGVWHLSNGLTLNPNDSTSNANNGTLNNSPPAGTGQIDGAAVFITSNSQSISIADNTTLKPSSVTYSMWFRRDGNQANTQHRLIEKGTDAAGPPFGSYFIQFTGGDASSFQSLLGIAGSATGWTAPTGTFTDLTWYNVAVTYEKTAVKSYVNGVLRNSVAASGAIGYDTNPLAFGAASNNAGGFEQFYKGNLDEVRISSGARSYGWIETQYNNENSPSTFVAYGAETSTPTSPPTRGLAINGGKISIIGGKLSIL